MASIAPSAHTRREGSTDSWITPKYIIDRLGPFDLDPCASIPQPWPCAARQFTIEDNGLMQRWDGFWYCNPPYGKLLEQWLHRATIFPNGIALVFARTDTKAFFRNVWTKADALLFIRGRLTFLMPDGTSSKLGHNSGGPSVLIGYGDEAVRRLKANSDLGALVLLKGH